MKFKDMPYKRVDYDKTAEQFKTLTKRVKEAKSGEELWEIHQEYYKVYQNMMDSMTIAEIRHDGNTADPFYAAEKDYYDETAPMLSSLATDYQRTNRHIVLLWKKRSAGLPLRRWTMRSRVWTKALSA